jgi:hypothetical protein
MRKLLCLLALACVGFAAPANAQNAVANVVQVTTRGNNTSTITQTARNTAVANVAQATIRGNNTSAITQHARNMAARVAQGTVRGNNTSSITQTMLLFHHHGHR